MKLTPRQLLTYALVRDHRFDHLDARAIAASVERCDSAWHRTNVLACVFSHVDAVEFRIAKAAKLLRASGYLPAVAGEGVVGL